MLRRIEFENFMSLKKVSVDLEPLTLFIGANASGKSAIFKGLVTLSRLANGAPLRGRTGEFALESGVHLDAVVWNGNSALPVRFRVWFANDPEDDPGYTLELRKRAEGWSVTHERIRIGNDRIEVDEDHAFVHPIEGGTGRYSHTPPLRATLRYLVHPFLRDTAARPAIQPILTCAERLGLSWRYRPSASDIASFVPHPTRDRKTYVRENGAGVASELQGLQGSKREIFEAIETAVRQVFPHIRSIGFNTDWQGVRLTFMTERSEDAVPAPQESDGVLLALFLFWRLYTGTDSMKVCLEEPENGLHPILLADRFRLLKHFTQPQEGRPSCQLLVATHSPEFLRALKAHPTALFKQTRLVEFDQELGTSVRGLASYREATKLIDKYLDELHDRWAGVVQNWE